MTGGYTLHTVATFVVFNFFHDLILSLQFRTLVSYYLQLEGAATFEQSAQDHNSPPESGSTTQGRRNRPLKAPSAQCLTA